MVTLVGWYVSIAIVQAALAVWVILAQPRRLLNWAVGALLLLWAGSGIVFQLMREAMDPAAYVLYNRIASYYETPTFFLILLIVDGLLLPAPRSRLRKALLALAALAVVALWTTHAVWPSVEPFPDTAPRHPVLRGTPTLLPMLNALMNVLCEVAVVFLACRAAVDERRSVMQRRQAALVGLAFTLLVAQAGGAALTGVITWGTPKGLSLLNYGASWLGAVAAVLAVTRLPRPFDGSTRPVVRGTIVVAMALGAIASTPPYPFAPFGIRVVALSAFALILGVAILRYDLADGGLAGRRRLQSVAAVLLGLAGGALLIGAAWSGSSRYAFGGALLALIAPVMLLATPLRAVPAWVTGRVLLHPRDPHALRERVRVYATTLQAATGPDGRVPDAATPALDALRAQLGLSRRDHDLLVASGAAEAHAPLVAYRIALASASADAQDLRGLRDTLGLTERDHEMVLADLRAGGDRLAEGVLFRDRYRVVRRIGEGGFGEVWLARDGRIGRHVVLKRLARHEARDARALRRVQREVRASSLLSHPNVVSVHDVEVAGDETYLVMEHLPGGSLADVLRAEGTLPEARVAVIGLDVLRALDALHARGIVHRDVKPANILLDAEGRAKLGDFTLARELVSGDTVGPDGPRGPVGTFAYMPPEQARGLTSRPPADLYALAATMVEMISGRPPIVVEGLSHREATTRIVQQPPALPDGASPRLREVLARALSKLPEDRFPDAGSMAAALEATRAGTPAGSGLRPARRPA